MMSDLDPTVLRKHRFLRTVEVHEELTSTNDRARALSPDRSQMPALIVAERQTAGRGRGANRWWTGAGSLAVSLLLDPAALGIERRHYPLMSLATAVAIVETVSNRLDLAAWVSPERLGLHWPNDVFVAGRKLAGILVEALPDGRHIVGIGLNANNSLVDAPPELASVATTLADLTGQTHDRTQILRELLDQLEPEFGRLAAAPEVVCGRADELCLQHGRTLTLQAGGRQCTGVCRGIAADGALLLETPAGLERHFSGALVHGPG